MNGNDSDHGGNFGASNPEGDFGPLYRNRQDPSGPYSVEEESESLTTDGGASYVEVRIPEDYSDRRIEFVQAITNAVGHNQSIAGRFFKNRSAENILEEDEHPLNDMMKNLYMVPEDGSIYIPETGNVAESLEERLPDYLEVSEASDMEVLEELELSDTTPAPGGPCCQ